MSVYFHPWQYQTSDRKDYHYNKSQVYFWKMIHWGACYHNGIFSQICWSNVNILDKCDLSSLSLVSVNDPKQKPLQLFSSNDTKSGLKIPLLNSHLGRWAQVILDIYDKNTCASAGLTVKHLKLYFTHSRPCLLRREWQGFTYFMPLRIGVNVISFLLSKVTTPYAKCANMVHDDEALLLFNFWRGIPPPYFFYAITYTCVQYSIKSH